MENHQKRQHRRISWAARGGISNNKAPIHQASLTRALQLKQIIGSDLWCVPHEQASEGTCSWHTLGFKGKVTNGAEKLSSKPIFMSAFPPAIWADKHLMWGGREKEGSRQTHISPLSVINMHCTLLDTIKPVTLCWEEIIMIIIPLQLRPVFTIHLLYTVPSAPLHIHYLIWFHLNWMNVFPVSSQQSFPVTLYLIVTWEFSWKATFRSIPFLEEDKIKPLEMDLQTVQPILSSCNSSRTV